MLDHMCMFKTSSESSYHIDIQSNARKEKINHVLTNRNFLGERIETKYKLDQIFGII